MELSGHFRAGAGWVDGGEFAFWLLGRSSPVMYSCLPEFLSLKNDVPSTLPQRAGFCLSACESGWGNL